jgi:hypothetical protein
MTEIAWYRRRDSFADTTGKRIPYETLYVAAVDGLLRTGIPLATFGGMCAIAFVVCGTLFGVMILAMCAPFVAAYAYGFCQASRDAIRLIVSPSRSPIRR